MTRASKGVRERVAVIGSGISGLTAAYALRRTHDVVLFEAEPRLGGHAHTHRIPAASAPGGSVGVDSAFVAYSERGYPTLTRLFAELRVPTRPTRLSLGIRCDGCGLEYAVASGPRGLFAQPGALRDTAYLRMLGELPRLRREATKLLRSGENTNAYHDHGPTLGDFLIRRRFSAFLVDHFMVPLVAAVWSTGLSQSLAFPAHFILGCLERHGMFRPGPTRWLTVTGGSATYVSRIAAQLPDIRLSTPVRAISRGPDGVTIHDEADRTHLVDRVVIAVHSDQALALLAEPTAEEKTVLGTIPYSRNDVTVHTDTSLLPARSASRANFNPVLAGCRRSGTAVAASAADDRNLLRVSYDMNQLHGIDGPVGYVVSLNCDDRIPQDKVLSRITYRHPVQTLESLAVQRRLPALNTGRTAYAGAYHGWGFHEDGCVSGFAAARSFRALWP